MDGNQKSNPFDSAGFFSRVFYCWFFPVLIKSWKKILKEEDLFEISKQYSSEYLGDLLQKEWEKELNKNNPSLLKALLRFVGWKGLLLPITLIIQDSILGTTQAYLIGLLVNYYDHRSDANQSTCYLTIAGFCVITVAYAILYIFQCVLSELIGMQIKVAFCTIIYRKAIRLSHSSFLAKSKIGKMVSLLANDSSKFCYNAYSLAYTISNPFLIIVTVGILWQFYGWSVLAGASIVIIFVPIQIFLGKLYSEFRLQAAEKGDERVSLVNEMITGMRLIKMYTWELPFASLIENARKNEIRKTKIGLYIRGTANALSYPFSKIFSCVTLLTFFFTGGHLTAQMIFTEMHLSITIFRSVFMLYSMGINQLAQFRCSIQRLQDFLLLQEKFETVNASEVEKEQHGESGISIAKVTANWNKDGEVTLKEISLNIYPRQLVAVVGHVGSGKTSLLMSILGEIPVTSGNVKVNGRIAYASQEAWVFHATIRENILFGEKFNEIKYKQILSVTTLEKDISLFPKGDLTNVGERGVIMSGGQKARINLARALYRDADIYILDDPLSAVDAPVAKHIFEKCIMGYLKTKICILVTHQIHFLKSASKILVLKEGKCEAVGDFDEIRKLEIDIGISNKVKNNDENDIELMNLLLEEESINQDSTIDLEKDTTASNMDNKDENVTTENEEVSYKMLDTSSYKAYVNAGAGIFIKITIVILVVLSQLMLSGSDMWLKKWIKDERFYYEHKAQMENVTLNVSKFNDIVAESFVSHRQNNAFVYCGLVIGFFILTIILTLSFYEMSMAASINLHKNMFRCMIRTPMSFLDMNPIGKILNRFSKDIMSIDELLPELFQNTIKWIAMFFGAIIVQAIISPYLLIFTAILTSIFYFLLTLYMRMLKNVKYLEGKLRSPVFSHLSATLYGLITIRAFNAENDFKATFNRFQDKHTITWFLYVSLVRWISVYGQMITIINVILAVVVLNFTLNSEDDGSNMGLVVTYGLFLVICYQYIVKQLSDVDFQMHSVSRIINYSNLESEAAYESSVNRRPNPNWPQNGEIIFDNVSLKYSKESHIILESITFNIHPGEKIGIVGRTGAGKSSLIAALFRMAEPMGDIIIDGINTKDIGLRDLRSKISIISQDPVLFTGSLRQNIDPFNEYSEEMLWQLLNEVQLKSVVEKLHGGLDTQLTEGGRNFSVGERQLICLARAILRRNKILVMDEATSNIDKVTDSLIQKIIRVKFKSCTVLTIAHRLHTIIDSDRVMVLDKGKLQEFDKPYALLLNVNGCFYNLVKNVGKTATEELYKLAKDKYYDKEYTKL